LPVAAYAAIALVAVLAIAGAVFAFTRDGSERATPAAPATATAQPAVEPTAEPAPTAEPPPPVDPAARPTPVVEAPSADATPEPTPIVEDPPPGDPTADSINVAVLSLPFMEDIIELTPEHFTAQTGIQVDYTVVNAETLRQITTRSVASGTDQFDVVVIGMYEAPQFGVNNWLFNLNTFANNDADYDVSDLMPSVRSGLSTDGNLYAAPIYAESSLLMYRQDLLDAAGLTMPASPTWDEVAAIARALDTDDVAGICLRGRHGWGDLGASFTTVLNTFGGTWWAANDDGSIGASQVDQPEFAEALNFYIDLVIDAGEDDAANSSFGECLALYQEGKVAMWYDSTVAAGFLESEDSPVRGLNNFALAPTQLTDGSGWLWAWALAIPASAPEPVAAWEYISWATSAQYQEQLASEFGWAALAPGTRLSLYERPGYIEATRTFGQRTLDALLSAPIDNPGTTPRPGTPGVQYVGVPEFQDVGNRCTVLFSEAIAGAISVADALVACHEFASEVAS